MKKKLFSLIAISLIVLLSGCTAFDNELKDAVKTGDPDACLDLKNDDGSPDQSRIDTCYKKIAINKEEHSICKRIESEHKSDECYGGIAVSKNDETLCPLAGTAESDCYKDIAIAKKNKDICRKITDSKYTKNSCFEAIAISTTNSKDCYEIQELSSRERCLNNYAIAVGDAWVCKELSTPIKQDICYQGVAVTEGNANICDKISEISSNSAYQSCIWRVAQKTGDHSVCAKLEEAKAKSHVDEIDECYYIVGYYHYKASACSSVKDEVKRNTCLVKVAEHNADTDICDQRIDRSDYKDECYKKIAWAQDHERYCEEISDSSVKAECLKRFKHE